MQAVIENFKQFQRDYKDLSASEKSDYKFACIKDSHNKLRVQEKDFD